MERWKPIPGFPNYEASSRGRIRSLPHSVTKSDGITYNQQGRVLSMGNGKYPRVRICDDTGKWEAQRVHHLVCLAFHGPRPPGLEACHADDDGWNNIPSNLSWGTPSKNGHDKVRNGRHHYARRDRCSKGHEYTPENVIQRPNGARGCRTCDRAYKRAYKARKRARDDDTERR
ncbi:HNH endonuclease [Gordonia phage ChisanaKitsune]|uniref:HNH endonuclease n=1 Tax=Gordonia phage ChisanaKitsune TaxID=2871538 RepID=A0AAE7XFD5_9CAUD|nr:HNH endonuclease [Gordonia phage ChisanaKitsune]QZE10892.1 HNH endonuclease [Gordonia phage ChisanaKitsune]